MTGDGLDADLPDDRVRDLVAALAPEWSVAAVDRVETGTDFVAVLDVRTPDGPRAVVLKATTAGLVHSARARAEPRVLELVGERTSIPVPTVYASCERHDDLPTPCYLLEYVDGEVYENRIDEISAEHRKRICRDAGRNIARLHELGPLSKAGGIGVEAGQLGVLDGDEHDSFEDTRDWLLDSCETTLDALADGGWFPELADEPDRFADLVPDLRRYAREAVPGLPPSDPPTYAHLDYRYGNLLVDPGTGATNAVLDWANVCATAPAYNLANAESLLLTPDRDPQERTAELREAFRSAYAAERSDWTFDADTETWLDVCHLSCRLDAMACLPLWYQHRTREGRDERAAEHRAFVEAYL